MTMRLPFGPKDAEVAAKARIARCGLDALCANLEIACEPVLYERKTRVGLRHRGIIIPSRMLPPRPSLPVCGPSRLWSACALALLLIGSRAHAQDPPSCPSIDADRAAPANASAEPHKAPSQAQYALAKPAADEKFDIDGDRFDVTLGQSRDVTAHGNVIVRQGDREIHADQAHYDSASNTVQVQGAVEYDVSARASARIQRLVFADAGGGCLAGAV